MVDASESRRPVTLRGVQKMYATKMIQASARVTKEQKHMKVIRHDDVT